MLERGALCLQEFVTFSWLVLFQTHLVARGLNPCVQVTLGIAYVCMELNLKEIPPDIPNSTQHLDLSFNPLGFLNTKDFSSFPALRFLDLTRCHITVIKDDAFAGLHDLSVLLLTGNPLQFVGPRAFQDLTSLQKLVLVETGLSSLDSLPIGHLKALQELNLSNNYIDSLKLPKYFSLLTQLKRLVLQSNRISSISRGDLDTLSTHDNLTLVLCRNNIKHIQPMSFKGVYLQELSLRSSFEDSGNMQSGLLNMTGLHVNSLVLGGHRNLLNDEPFNRNLLDGLCHMDLQKITLICIGDAFSRTESLSACVNNISAVRFVHTYLETLDFPENTNIRHLECKDCKFDRVPVEKLAALKELRVLRITNTDSLTEFHLGKANWTLRNLEVLDLSNNKLNTGLLWSKLKERFPSLRVLNLSSNPIVRVSAELIGPTTLKYFYLQHSRLQGPGKVPTFLCLKNLVYLDISYTGTSINTECAFCGLDSLEVLKMAGNSFKDNRIANTFTNVTKLKILDISNCQLQHVSLGSFDHLCDLRELNISNNKLLDFYPKSYVHLHALTILDFHHNQLITLTKKHLENLPSSLRRLDLSQNLFDCSCDRLDFLRWAKEHKDLLMNAEVMKCHSPSHFEGTQLMNFDISSCQVSTIMVAVSVSVSVVVVLSLILVYKFYFHLYYITLLLSGGHSSPDHNKTYDAFVIYSSEDQVWVKRELEETLESGVPRFRLCFHYRDFRPGVPIITNIIKEGFHSSRKVIAVVSTKFLESRWCNFELEVAQSWQLLDSKGSLIFIVLDGVDRAVLRQKLGLFRYLRRNTYLVWKDKEVKRHIVLRQLKSVLLDGKTWTEDELRTMLVN